MVGFSGLKSRGFRCQFMGSGFKGSGARCFRVLMLLSFLLLFNLFTFER
jgi:hypothetical protein